ncbi:MAG: hypothetical protein AAGN35_18490 [Bacteroidota bacterium]
MKRLYVLFLLGLLGCVHTAALAQESTTEKVRRPALRFGINFGGSWQTSDVRAIAGAGLGATLEVPIIENDRSLIGVSLRGRYLWTVTFGRDWERSFGIQNNPAVNGTYDVAVNYFPSPGYIYANHRTSSHNWDLELMLKANRLRARTGILAYIWGGIGAMGYRARVDQFDSFQGTRYDWTAISTDSKSEALRDLDFALDGIYETSAEETRRPRWVLAPSLGIGLGYEFSPSFSIAFEYKVTFPFTDLLDGQQWDDNNILTQDDDIHHYGGFGVVFGLFGGGRSTRPPRNNPNTFSQSRPRPQIIPANPGQFNSTVGGNCFVDFRARVSHVTSKTMITVIVNGGALSSNQFNFVPSTGVLTAGLSLRRGRNTVRVVARNRSGNSAQNYTIECNQTVVLPPPPPPPPTGLPPEVYITFPTGCPAIIHDCATPLYAEVYRVQSKADIQVLQNGNRVSPNAYSYDPYNQMLNVNLRLLPGDARIEIIARNRFGQDRASTVLRCPAQVVLPTVTITNPAVSPAVSANCTPNLEARVTGVRSRNDISVFLDGALQRPEVWTWNAGSGILRMTVNLVQGRNSTVEIIAQNANGRAADVQVLRCEETLPPPVVNIINPTNGVYNGTDCNQRITAQVLNVAGRQDIRVQANGQTLPYSAWTYNSFNQLLVMDVQLTPGVQNRYLITATNRVGSDSEEARLICNQPVQTITICNIPPGNPAGAQTITIPRDAWPSYQAQGAIQGPCSSQELTVCYQGNTIIVPQSTWPTLQGWGATQGRCPVETITICNIPPRNPAGATTMTISADDWPLYQAQGAIQGPCSNQQVTVCLNGSQQTISQTALSAALSLGATQGPCLTSANITICNIPPGNPAGATTMTISASEWPTYQAQGALQGPCSSQQVTVCIDGNQQTISQSALSAAVALGAIQGPCPPSTITICNIPPRNPSAATTITINAEEWPAYQAQGAVQGPCAKRQIDVCYNNQTISIPSNAWPTLQGMGATQGPCLNSANITICNIPPGNPAGATTMTISEEEWPTYQAQGAVRGPCSTTQVTVCFDGNQQTISQSALQLALSMGATEGPCPPATITICNVPPRNPAGATTMTINSSEWPSYQAQGAVQGACSDQKIDVCFNNRTISIPANVWPTVQGMGATQGPCLNTTQIQICVIPPGQPENAQTITINDSEWPTYQAQGAVRGPCSTQQVTICMDANEMTVSQTALPLALSMGATEGPCPRNIQICSYPPGQFGNAQTITIDESQWPSYQAQGAVQGACSPNKVTICFRDETFQVSESIWPGLQAQGATQGPCPIKITICHIPPEDPDNPETIQILPSQLGTYLANGSSTGPCDMTPIQICYEDPGNPDTRRVMTIPQALWRRYQSLGATLGECPEQILICEIPPGGLIFPNNKMIDPEDWPAYEANYAHKGQCSHVMIDICHIPPSNPNTRATVNVSQSSWRYHQARGATMGPCAEGTSDGGNQEGSGSGGSRPTPSKGSTTVRPNPTTPTVRPKTTTPSVRPKTTTPKTTQPVRTQPRTTTPKTTQPVRTQPRTTTPKTTQPVRTQPRTTTPKTTQPVRTQPRTTTPKTTQPVRTQPKTTTPKTTQPVRTQPKTTKPKTTQPARTQPKTTAPKTTAPKSTKGKSTIKTQPKTTAPKSSGGKGAIKSAAKMITICEKVPKNPRQTRTIKIKESEWALYKKRGATLGPCK